MQILYWPAFSFRTGETATGAIFLPFCSFVFARMYHEEVCINHVRLSFGSSSVEAELRNSAAIRHTTELTYMPQFNLRRRQ